MKIELQSGSSDFGDFEENRHYDENSVFNPKKNLWNASNSNSDRRRSGSMIPKSRDPEHDDDFEFVITRSETAKRVKKPNSNSFMHHNYANSNEKYNSRHSYDHSQTSSNSYGRGTGKHENNYHKYDNQNNYSKYNNASTGYRGSLEDSPTAYRRKPEQKAHNKLGHPGLDRKIDFDPFVSGSNSEDDSGSVHEDDAFTYRKDVRHFEHGFPDQHLTSVTYTNRSLLPKRRYIFLAKIKIFFKFVGVGIKRCYNKSKTYISKVIRKTKDKRRNRKCRDRLLNNQQEPGDVDSETGGEIKSGRKHSQSSVLDSRRRSDSPFDLPPNQDPGVKRRFRLPRFKFGRSNKPTFKVHKDSVKQVKLHSFPD